MNLIQEKDLSQTFCYFYKRKVQMDICKNKFKGKHLLGKNKWKEDFLLKIEEQGIPTKTYVDDNKYKIIGLHSLIESL